MRSPFHPDDADRLIAEPTQFDLDALEDGHGSWGSQLLRNVTALEMTFQLTERMDSPVVLKGGTLLQSRLHWPPLRASIDLDIEVTDASEVERIMHEVARGLGASGIGIAGSPRDPLPGRVLKLTFPGVGLPESRTLRIDILETPDAGEGHAPWMEAPDPWKRAKPPLVPSLEAQAAQKLLMLAPAPFGRDLTHHRGRGNRIKDLFDLACLGRVPLDSEAILRAASDEVVRKSRYMGREYALPSLIEEGSGSLLALAGPAGFGPDSRLALWRAHAKVRPTIREPFLDAQLRMSAGCSYCALHHIRNGTLDWLDAWRPYSDRAPRKRWVAGRTMETVVAVEDGFGPERGVMEAWALP